MRRTLYAIGRFVLIVLALSAAVLTSCAHGDQSATSTASKDAAEWLSQRMEDLSTRSGPGDPFWFGGGRWHVGDDSCSRCLLGPTVVAAALVYRDPEGHADLRDRAAAATDTFLAKRQRPDGTFPANDATGSSVGVNTMFVGEQLATIDLLLGPRVDAGRRARWNRAVAAAADALLRAKDPQWYSNGNINLGYTLVLGLAARLTGRADLLRAYEASWKFVLAPPTPRWRGYGLRYRRVPTRADGADGAGYLTESGGGGVGFDAHYTQLQADRATRIWLTLGDRRALRLVNLLNGMLVPRLNQRSWMLDTSSGTRNTSRGLSFPFITASLAAGQTGCSGDTADEAPAQVAGLERWFSANLDSRSLHDNGSWAYYLGESAANFVLLPDRSACG